VIPIQIMLPTILATLLGFCMYLGIKGRLLLVILLVAPIPMFFAFSIVRALLFPPPLEIVLDANQSRER
jgi:hypothetical protein